MKKQVFKPRVVLIALILGQFLPLYGISRTRNLEVFEIKKEPGIEDWQEFMAAPESLRLKLWDYHYQAGRGLEAWAWQWRIAWLKTCIDSNNPTCGKILSSGLVDKAMVVRSEAAELIGRRFSGQNVPLVISHLNNAYLIGRNQKRGRPLPVRFKILAALRSINSKKALTVGSRLSSMHRETRQYWLKITQL